VKPTRIKVGYFKATCINAVNNVGIIGGSRHKVKMWACEHFRAVLFNIETFVLVVPNQAICFDGINNNERQKNWYRIETN
jgi:hypothetical protein